MRKILKKTSKISWLMLLLQLCLSFSLLAKQAFDFSFEKGHAGWVGDFADYDVGQEAFFELGWGWTSLPTQLDLNGTPLQKGMLLTGNNHSDDLFMFLKHRVEGLKPNTYYHLTFRVVIENNVSPDQFGVGGSPGESVFFKVGASRREPKKVAEGSIYRLNVDKGNQSQSGKYAIVVGDLANPLVDPLDPTYQPKQFVNEIPLKVRTDHRGRLWLFVGTDSGFEALTTYYVAHISVVADSKH